MSDRAAAAHDLLPSDPFTLQATVANQNVGTGTIQIGAAMAAESAPIDVSELLPGDELGTAIDVTNIGDAGERWSVALPVADDGDADLTDVLEMTVRVGGDEAQNLTTPVTLKLTASQR